MAQRITTWIIPLGLGVWGLLVCALIVPIMAWHLIPLPASDANQPVRLGETGEWRAIHILVSDCPCSSSVAERLHPLSKDAKHYFHLVGDDDLFARELASIGLRPAKDSVTLLRKLKIAGGPWLIIVSPEGEVVYSGGYSDHPPSRFRYTDLPLIIEQCLQGNRPRPRPAFGCAIDQALKTNLDPFGLK